jgi:hypothetical protein
MVMGVMGVMGGGMIMTHGAAKTPASPLFVAPTRVAFQAVLHQVGTFKIVAFNRRDNKHAC